MAAAAKEVKGENEVIIKSVNIEPGIYTMQICDNLNKERKRNPLYKISDKYKKRRNLIRHLSKQKQDKNIEVEGTSYEAGGFFSNFLNGSGYDFCIFYLNLTKLGQLVNITYMYDLKF